MPGKTFLHDIPGNFIIATPKHQVAEQFVLVLLVKLSVFIYHCEKKSYVNPESKTCMCPMGSYCYFMPGYSFSMQPGQMPWLIAISK